MKYAMHFQQYNPSRFLTYICKKSVFCKKNALKYLNQQNFKAFLFITHQFTSSELLHRYIFYQILSTYILSMILKWLGSNISALTHSIPVTKELMTHLYIHNI